MEDFYWFIGLMEGEGSFHVAKSGKNMGRASISLKMTDLDVVERAAVIVGRLLDREPPNIAEATRYRHQGFQPQYQWQIGGHADVLRLAEIMAPYMGERRERKLGEIIQRTEAWLDRVG